VAGDHHREGIVKRCLKWLFAWALGLCLGAIVFALLLIQLLRPAAGEWSHPLRVGTWQINASVPAMLRMATHPLTLRALEGRTLRSRFGPVQWRAGAHPGHWRAVCAPCTLRLAELGDDTIRWSRIELELERTSQNDFKGEFALGDAPHAVRGKWTAHLDATGAQLSFKLPATPMADAYGLFASAIPELARARIDGQLRLDARLRLPSREWIVRPQIDGFAVSGLGTDALLTALPTCHGKPSALKFGTWLPRAVVAAEDQRFYEHSGYDLDEIVAAWSPGAARGASTLSQQLAKLIYTGDSRSHVRKLRELLYAVELDRTLGKARVLNLYLAIAPWGNGLCGAHAAAWHHAGKRADQLTPTEAAWLASLLRNPDRELELMAQRGHVDIERVAWVINNLRPLAKARREALVEGLDGWSPAVP
jgi:hypothetical protein